MNYMVRTSMALWIVAVSTSDYGQHYSQSGSQFKQILDNK